MPPRLQLTQFHLLQGGFFMHSATALLYMSFFIYQIRNFRFLQGEHKVNQSVDLFLIFKLHHDIYYSD